MKRFFKFSTFFVAVALIFASCSKKEFTVTFNSNGGSAVASVIVEAGKTIAEPVKPTRSGFEFAGWYTTPAFVKQWNFASDVVNADMTLYAKWDVDAERVTVKLSTSSNYFSQEGGLHQSYCFWLVFFSDEYFYGLDLYAPSFEVMSDGFFGPQEGTYDFDPAGTMANFTIGGTYSFIVERLTEDEDELAIRSGYVTISKDGDNYTLEGVFVDEKGTPHSIVYSGKLAFEDLYSEPVAITTENFTGTGMYSEEEEDGLVYYYVALFDDLTSPTFLSEILLFPDDDTFDGIYTFRKWESDEDIPGSAMAGKYQDGDIFYSYAATIDGGYLDKVWGLNAGTVTVSGTNIVVAATSVNGSTINIIASDVTEDISDGVPAKTKGKKEMLKRSKIRTISLK